jgi:hypothetical protein
MSQDELILDESYFKVEAALAPSSTLNELLNLAKKRLADLCEDLLATSDFMVAREKALSGLADSLSDYLQIALTLGVENYRHRLSLPEKDVAKAFAIPIDLLSKFASEADEKYFAMSFGAMLNLSLLYGTSFQDIRKVYADRALERYDAIKGKQE